MVSLPQLILEIFRARLEVLEVHTGTTTNFSTRSQLGAPAHLCSQLSAEIMTKGKVASSDDLAGSYRETP